MLSAWAFTYSISAFLPSILFTIFAAEARVMKALGLKVPSPFPEIHPRAAASAIFFAAQCFSETSVKVLDPFASILLNRIAMAVNSALVIFPLGSNISFPLPFIIPILARVITAS